jgi:hypothetical protein
MKLSLFLSNAWNIFSAPELAADELAAPPEALSPAAMAANGTVKAAAIAAAIKLFICMLISFSRG